MNIETEIDSLAIKVNQKNKVTKFIISYAFKGAACAFVKWNLLNIFCTNFPYAHVFQTYKATKVTLTWLMAVFQLLNK